MRNAQSGPLLKRYQVRLASGTTINSHVYALATVTAPGVRPGDVVVKTGVSGDLHDFTSECSVETNDTITLAITNQTAAPITLAADLVYEVMPLPNS
jgi:hypothetical protein